MLEGFTLSVDLAIYEVMLGRVIKKSSSYDRHLSLDLASGSSVTNLATCVV